MHHAVNGGGGGHRILEDLIPLGEHDVGRDHDAPALVPLGQQGEQHFHFGAVVLHIADVIEYPTFNALEPAQLACQPQIALGFQPSSSRSTKDDTGVNSTECPLCTKA